MISFSKLGYYGRLGNQLFQIAATISHSKFVCDDYVIPKWKYSSYFEYNFNEGSNFATTIYQEPFFHYTEIPKIKNIDLQGYFQSDKYFFSYEFVKSLFKLKPEIMRKLKNKYNFTDSVSIHVRRGDYLIKNDYHPVLNIEYYQKAVEYISKKRKIDNIFVFSDDIEWCKNNLNFKNFNVIYVTGNEDIEDLYLMSFCENNIIANSSFSWWSSFLNDNINKIIIAPKIWFGPKLNLNTKDLYRNEMIKI